MYNVRYNFRAWFTWNGQLHRCEAVPAPAPGLKGRQSKNISALDFRPIEEIIPFIKIKRPTPELPPHSCV